MLNILKKKQSHCISRMPRMFIAGMSEHLLTPVMILQNFYSSLRRKYDWLQ